MNIKKAGASYEQSCFFGALFLVDEYKELYWVTVFI